MHFATDRGMCCPSHAVRVRHILHHLLLMHGGVHQRSDMLGSLHQTVLITVPYEHILRQHQGESTKSPYRLTKHIHRDNLILRMSVQKHGSTLRTIHRR